MLWSLYTFTNIKKMSFKIKKLCFRRVFTIYKNWKLISIIKTNPNIFEALRITWCQQTKAKSLFDIMKDSFVLLWYSLSVTITPLFYQRIYGVTSSFLSIKSLTPSWLCLSKVTLCTLYHFCYMLFLFYHCCWIVKKVALKKYIAKKCPFFLSFLLRVCFIRNLFYVWLVKTFWTTWKNKFLKNQE